MPEKKRPVASVVSFSASGPGRGRRGRRRSVRLRGRIAYSITGIAIEQFQQYAPEVMDTFQELNRTGCVEFLDETYYHSLSFLYSREEFRAQA